MTRTLVSLLAALAVALAGTGPARAGTGPAERIVTSKPHRAPVKPRRAARTRSLPPGDVARAIDPRSSQRGVCQSQCSLERMACDQGRANAFRERADQLQAASSSCYLAVNACLARC